MKAITPAIIALAAALGAVSASADEVMNLTYKDGTAAKFIVSDIKDMTFETPGQPATEGHGYVDLGLPSQLKWATCNVGADRTSDLGSFFSWGETTPKERYINGTCVWYGKTEAELQEQGVVDAAGNLTAQYDAAAANWGDDWRMPTDAEIGELVENCTWEWGTLEGRFGCTVTGPNGNSIFLPASGYRGTTSFVRTIYEGYYWSSTMQGKNNSYELYFDEGKQTVGYMVWFYGNNVRPVSDSLGFDLPRPQNVQAAEADGIVTISWDAVEGATSYVISRSSDGKNFEEIGTVTTTSFTDASPSPGNNYYRVQAVGVDGALSPLAILSQPVVIPFEVIVDGHGCVDLGLSSGLRWASCNLGAATPSEFGDYYAWGETVARTSFSLYEGKWNGVSYNGMYQNDVIDYDGNLTAEYDAASVNWGGRWRMPTKDEMQELIDQCSWEWTSMDGNYGALVTGPNGAYIFLPAVGYYYDADLIGVNVECNFWSTTAENNTEEAFLMYITATSVTVYADQRFLGFPVRAVADGDDQ